MTSRLPCSGCGTHYHQEGHLISCSSFKLSSCSVLVMPRYQSQSETSLTSHFLVRIVRQGRILGFSRRSRPKFVQIPYSKRDPVPTLWPPQSPVQESLPGWGVGFQNPSNCSCCHGGILLSHHLSSTSLCLYDQLFYPSIIVKIGTEGHIHQCNM